MLYFLHSCHWSCSFCKLNNVSVFQNATLKLQIRPHKKFACSGSKILWLEYPQQEEQTRQEQTAGKKQKGKGVPSHSRAEQSLIKGHRLQLLPSQTHPSLGFLYPQLGTGTAKDNQTEQLILNLLERDSINPTLKPLLHEIGLETLLWVYLNQTNSPYRFFFPSFLVLFWVFFHIKYSEKGKKSLRRT